MFGSWAPAPLVGEDGGLREYRLLELRSRAWVRRPPTVLGLGLLLGFWVENARPAEDQRSLLNTSACVVLLQFHLSEFRIP